MKFSDSRINGRLLFCNHYLYVHQWLYIKIIILNLCWDGNILLAAHVNSCTLKFIAVIKKIINLTFIFGVTNCQFIQKYLFSRLDYWYLIQEIQKFKQIVK